MFFMVILPFIDATGIFSLANIFVLDYGAFSRCDSLVIVNMPESFNTVIVSFQVLYIVYCVSGRLLDLDTHPNLTYFSVRYFTMFCSRVG